MSIAFGHDEEISGHQGAEVMSNLLESRGVIAEYVLDEGFMVVENALTGLNKPFGF